MPSIAELLPKPFDQLGIDDVASIISGPSEERESLVLELKAELGKDLIAKSCDTSDSYECSRAGVESG